MRKTERIWRKKETLYAVALRLINVIFSLLHDRIIFAEKSCLKRAA